MNTHKIFILLFIVAMVVIIIAVDVLFFRDQFQERLMANIGIVLIAIAFYLRYLR